LLRAPLLLLLLVPLLQTAKIHISQGHRLTLPIAESTTQGRFSWKEQMMSATSRMRSASRTLEPPNLYTMFTW
jgi:hypothetical protein